MYSDCTRLPKFTCTVRKKFFELSIYNDIPPGGLSNSETVASLASSFPRSLKFEWNDGLPPMTIDGITLEFISEFMTRLVHRVCDLIDMFEPLHFRRFATHLPSTEIYWSYSFSIVKWKNAICYFRPYLKDALDFHDSLHRHGHHLVLQYLERLFTSRWYDGMIWWLNIHHEGISNMEGGPMVDIRAKRELLDHFQHHIFHIYREIFPKTRRSNKARRSDDMCIQINLFSLFSGTSSLLPEDFRSHRLGFIGAKIMEHQRKNSTLEQATTTGTNSEPSLESHQQVKRFPPPNPYIPAKMAVILGMDTVMVAEYARLNQELLLEQEPSLQSCALEYSAWTLSLMLRVIFVQFDVETGTDKAIIPILDILSVSSFQTWDLLSKLASRSGATETCERMADWIMTNRDMLEALMIDFWTDIFDESLAPYGTTFKKRPKRVVQE